LEGIIALEKAGRKMQDQRLETEEVSECQVSGVRVCQVSGCQDCVFGECQGVKCQSVKTVRDQGS